MTLYHSRFFVCIPNSVIILQDMFYGLANWINLTSYGSLNKPWLNAKNDFSHWQKLSQIISQKVFSISLLVSYVCLDFCSQEMENLIYLEQ